MFDWINEFILKLFDHAPDLYRKLFSKKLAIERLYDILKGYYITSKIELEHQVRCYVPQKFKSFNGEILTIQELKKQIIKLKGDCFTIYGKPASGKTTAMRYLYCKLSKNYKCIYIQMKKLKDLEDLKVCLRHQKTDGNMKDGEKVVAFFDGVDEAISFLQVEDFFSVFFKGIDSQIYALFNEYSLEINNIILGMRPEFLENCMNDLRFKKENISMLNFQIMKMSDKGTLKIFKFLKKLKKKEAKLLQEKQRHQFRYPQKKVRKYIRLLKRILKNDSDSIFHYPMYVRYAYAYMKEYEKTLILTGKNMVSDQDMACAFDVLVRAISKWEFHVYYQYSSVDRPQLWEEFYATMKNCINDIIEVMLEDSAQKSITHGQLQMILDKYYLRKEEGTQGEFEESKTMSIVISHCFMVSDFEGKNFEFCHLTFYEYFLARYLLERADFSTRKQCLCSKEATENLKNIYYSIFCANNIELNKKISASIVRTDVKQMSVNECMKLGDEDFIEVVDEPLVSITQIYEYFPEIHAFLYRDILFTGEWVEQTLNSGILDISETGWEFLRYTDALLVPEAVEKMNLFGLNIKDINALKKYKNIKTLNMCKCGTDRYYAEKVLPIIKDMPLEKLYLYSEDGYLCEQIYHMLERGEFRAEKVYWIMPDYSEAYLKLYQLKQKAGQTGRKFHFYVNKRIDLGRAMLEYEKGNEQKDPDILKAVFELEADGNEELGLDKEDSESTFWTGLSFAKYYVNQDYVDPDHKAYNTYRRIEPFIAKNKSKISAAYGWDFANNLRFHGQYSEAKEWIKYVNSFLDNGYFSEDKQTDLRLDLYALLQDQTEEELSKLREDLEIRLTRLPNYKQNWKYMRYLFFKNSNFLANWKKGEHPPEDLWERHQEFWDIARCYSENNSNNDYLITAVHRAIIIHNRMENLKESAALLNELEKIIELNNKSNTERMKQANWIRYHEQKLYHLFLANQKGQAVEVANKLMEYPYWPIRQNANDYRYIRDVCMQNEDVEAIDKHRLWGYIWY